MSDSYDETRKKYEAVKAGVETRLKAFRSLVQKIVRKTYPTAKVDDYRVTVGGRTVGFQTQACGGGYSCLYGTSWQDKARIRFSNNGHKRHSYVEPKKGFDAELWAARIVERFKDQEDSDKRDVKLRAHAAEQEKICARLKKKHGIESGYLLEATYSGFQISISGLTEEQADAILVTITKLGLH